MRKNCLSFALMVAIAIGTASCGSPGSRPVAQQQLPEAQEKSEDGWIDLSLTLENLGRDAYGRMQGVARGSHQGKPIAFGFVLGTAWNQSADGAPIRLSWGKAELFSTGAESDAFLQVLDSLYQTRMGCSRMRARTNFAAVSLQGDPAKVEREAVRLKLFFENEDESQYAEVYLNINSSKAVVEFHEKDPDYRKAIVMALCEAKR